MTALREAGIAASFDTSGIKRGTDQARTELAALGAEAKRTERELAATRREVGLSERAYHRLVSAVDPAERAKVRLTKAEQTLQRAVASGAITQQQASETLRKAQTFYGAQAAAVRNLGDLFDKVGGKPAIFAGYVFAAWQSLKAGIAIGTQVRNVLNEITDGGYDRWLEETTGLQAKANSIAERWVGVQDEAADAADRHRANLVLLRLHGIEAVGDSAEEAAGKVQTLQRVLNARQRVEAGTEALLGSAGVPALANQGTAIAHAAWQQVKNGTEEARQAVASYGAELAKALRTANSAVPPFLEAMEQVAASHKEGLLAQRESARESERLRQIMTGQAAEANRIAQAWQLVAKGMKPEQAERFLVAARALGKNNLLDPLVKSFAAIAEKVELTLLKLKNAPGTLEPIQFDPFDPQGTGDQGPPDALQKRTELLQRWNELLAETITDEERRLSIILEAEKLAKKLGASEEELNRIRIHHAGTIGEVQYEEERLAAASEHVTSALGFLAGELGGFFDDLYQFAQRLQSAQGFGQSVGGIAGSIPGVSAGAASAFGAAAGYLAIWYAIYDTVKQLSADSKTRLYGTHADFEIRGGQSSMGGVGDQTRELQRAIRDVVSALEDALRISITDLGEIGVKVRNDGKHFKAYFEGLLLGKFSSLEAAIGAALTHAFRTGGVDALGLTELMEQGLASGIGNDVNELVETLSQLREIGDLGLTDAVIQAQETTRRLDDLWLALERLGEATPAVVEGFENLIASELRMWNDLFDGITGRQRTPAELMEQRRQELAIATAELAVRKAVIAQRILEIHATIAAIRAGRQLIGVGGGTPGGAGVGTGTDSGGAVNVNRVGDGILGVAGAFATAGQALGVVAAGVVASSTLISATGNALGQAAIDMLAALEAEADALQRLLDALPTPPGEDEIKPPRGAGGGGRRAQVRDWLDDNDFRLATEALGPVQRQLAELNREYDEQAAALRRGSAELARLNEQREREAGIIRRQGIDDAYGALRALEGRDNQFTDLEEQADAAREKFDDLFAAGAIGAERYAVALARVAAAERERIRALTVEGYQQLLGSANEYLEDTEIAKELERARFEAVVATYEAEFELLRLRGDLTDAEAERLGIVLEALRGVDFDAWWNSRQRRSDPPRGDSGGSRSDPATDLAKLVEEARDLLTGYRDDRRHPIELRLRKIDEDFTKIFRTLGRGTETLEEYRFALARVDEEMKQSIRDVLDALGEAEYAPTSGDQRLRQAETRARDLATRARGGDYQAFEDVAGAIQDWVEEAQAYAPSSPYFYSVFEEANRLLRELLSLRLFAGGGVSSRPAIFGERGPEAAVPLPDGRTIPVTLTAGGMAPVVAAVDRSGLASAQALARILAAIERLESGQAALRGEQERTRGTLDRHVALAGSLARRAG